MSREVNDETRDLIFRVAKEQGCFKKFFNAKYPKPVVAVLCPELHSQAYAMQVRYLKDELEARDCTVCVSAYDFRKDTVVELIGYYERYTSVDAVISLGGLPSFVYGHEIPLMGGGWKDNMQVYQLTDTVQVVLAGANRNVISQGEYGDLQCVSDPILYGIIAPAKLLAPKKIGQIQTGYVIDGNIIYGVNCNAFINEFDGSMEILMGIRRLPARRSMKCFRGGNTRS